MEDDLNLFLKNQNDDLQKNGKQPKKNKNGRRPKKMEDDLEKKWKTTSKKIEDNLKNGSQPQKNTI